MDLLTAVSTTRKSESSDELLKPQVTTSLQKVEPPKIRQLDAAQDESSALSVLREQAGIDEILQALKLVKNAKGRTDAQHAAILQTLLTSTIPNYWHNIRIRKEGQESECRKYIVELFRSVLGLGALTARLTTLNGQMTAEGLKSTSGGKAALAKDILEVLSLVLSPYESLHSIWSQTQECGREAQKQTSWREITNILAGGRALSTIMETVSLIGDVGTAWVKSGRSYGNWLGHSISHLVQKAEMQMPTTKQSICHFVSRSFSLGHTDAVIECLFTDLLLIAEPNWTIFFAVLNGLPQHNAQALFASLTSTSIRLFLAELSSDDGTVLLKCDSIGATASMFQKILLGDARIKQNVIEDLAGAKGSCKNGTLHFRRAMVLALCYNEDDLKTVMSEALALFSDKIAISTLPLRQQEAIAQTILLSAGSLHRSNPTHIQSISRSSLYLNSVTNRLSASSIRARFLGMVIGMALSGLVEDPSRSMKFDLDEMRGPEALWYLSLTTVRDQLRPMKELESVISHETKEDSANKTSASKKTDCKSTKPATSSKIISIEELPDSEEDGSDDGLQPYAKPDSDPEDSEDDATLVNRTKPSAPVYIRNLIASLRASEDHDRYVLAVETAPALIRRKTGFGSELQDQAEELALVTTGLEDKYDTPDFQKYRLSAMIALILSSPPRLAPWFIKNLFEMDLSLAQRSMILTAVGLSGRQLAGFREEDSSTLQLTAFSNTSTAFPSKRLSPHLDALYSETQSPIETLQKKVTNTTIQPMALSAADAVTGPSALKVRTFSSRMDVERRRKEKETRRNAASSFHKTIAESFFLPVISRFTLCLSSIRGGNNPFLSPHLCKLTLQTLTLLLSTAGPNNPRLAECTGETIELLIFAHTRPHMATDAAILPALLSLFLAVIDINVERGSIGEDRLMGLGSQGYGAQVLELREWVGGVFEQQSGSGKESEDARMLSAAVMVRLGEVIGRYQGRLVGVNSGFEF